MNCTMWYIKIGKFKDVIVENIRDTEIERYILKYSLIDRLIKSYLEWYKDSWMKRKIAILIER